MTNAQLLLTIGIPTVTVLVGIFLNNARFGSIDGRLDRIEADFRTFYHELGRHEGEIEALKRK